MVRISFEVSEDTRQELKLFAVQRGQTIRSLMLWFVENVLSGKIDPSPLWLGTEWWKPAEVDNLVTTCESLLQAEREGDGQWLAQSLKTLRTALEPFAEVSE